jgi:O-antigen/teichoic acid export membrane protein
MLVSIGVNYLGEARRRVPLVAAMLAANVGIDVLFLPEIGIVAAAIANDVAYAIWVPGHLLILHRVLGMPLRPHWLALVRATAAAAVAALPLLALGTDVGVVVLVLGVALQCVVYVAALRATGELSRSDLAFLRSLLARRFGWARR